MGRRKRQKATAAHNFVWFVVFVACMVSLVVWGNEMLANDPFTAGEHDHHDHDHDHDDDAETPEHDHATANHVTPEELIRR